VSLTDFLKPRHQHRDPAIRIRAVEAATDEAILVRIACEDPDLEVRHRAVDRLKRVDALRSVALDGKHLDARLKAVAKIQDPQVLAEVMRERKNPDLMMACFEQIKDQSVLEKIARDPAYNVTARRIAINMFADQNLLADILKSVRAPALRDAAARRIQDPALRREAEERSRAEQAQPDRHMDRILERYDPEVVVEMLGAFRDSTAAVRGLGVILARGGAAGERAGEILGRFLLHAKPEIRRAAVAQLKPAAASMVEELQELAEKDADPQVRSALRELISEVGDKPDA
jgi:hypothetical protein